MPFVGLSNHDPFPLGKWILSPDKVRDSTKIWNLSPPNFTLVFESQKHSRSPVYLKFLKS